MDLGWIKLHRRLREHWLWPSDRPYSTLEAWLDLILSANHKAITMNAGFNIIAVDRGQYLTSQMKLSKKWRWHRETVSKFLRMLEREKMASIQTSNKTSTGYTLITIQNYSKYQDPEQDTADTRTDTQTDDQTTVERQSSGTYNNVKNEKNSLHSPKVSHLNHRRKSNGTKPQPVPCFKETMALYSELFVRRVGAKPDIDGGRDGKLLSGLLKAHGADEVTCLLRYFFEHPPAWVEKNGKFTIPAFKSAYTEVLAQSRNGKLQQSGGFVG